MTNTTLLHRNMPGAGWGLANIVYRKLSGAWGGANAVYLKQGGVWAMIYSTPTVSCGNISGAGSGPASTGSVTSSAASPSIGGTASGNYAYAWAYVSGDGAITCSNEAAASPTFNKSNCGTGGASALWQLTVTDNASGATASCQITISLSWTQTFSPFTQSFTSGGSSGSVTVPAGASHLAVIMVGGGGYGGSADYDISSGDYGGGGGGGSGGYQNLGFSIGSGDWGSTINYTVGQYGGAISGGSSGSAASVSGWTGSYSAGGGGNGGGGHYPIGGSGGTAGSPGGNTGGSGSINNGGAGGASPYGGYGLGADGGGTSVSPNNGTDGVIIFEWT